MDNVVEYWDKEWSRRLDGDGSVKGNMLKVDFLINELWTRPHLIDKRKLEVGCGPATHVRHLSTMCREWARKYQGIDTSKVAIDEAVKGGMNARLMSVFDIIPLHFKYPIESFFFFDVLEHIEDHEAVAEKIRSVAAPAFNILINVPLYRSKLETDGGFERNISIQEINNFLFHAGIERFEHQIYGLNGYPYMFVEGFKE